MASKYLKIQNNHLPNGRVFEVERAAAEHSAVIRMLLKDFEDFDSTDMLQAIIPISIQVSDACLTKVFQWATHWKNMAKADDGAADARITFTAWDNDFFRTVDSEMLYELLITANYLEIKPLYDMGCQVVVDMISGRSTEEIRAILGVKNDFTPAQEAAIRQETAWAYDGGQNL